MIQLAIVYEIIPSAQVSPRGGCCEWRPILSTIPSTLLLRKSLLILNKKKLQQIPLFVCVCETFDPSIVAQKMHQKEI